MSEVSTAFESNGIPASLNIVPPANKAEVSYFLAMYILDTVLHGAA